MSKTTKKQPTSQINYTEMVTAKLKEKIEEVNNRMTKANEALERIIEVRNKHGNSPEIEKRIVTLRQMIETIRKDKIRYNQQYGVPSRIMGAAKRIDNAKAYDEYLSSVLSMNQAIVQYIDSLNEFEWLVKDKGGSTNSPLLSETKRLFADFSQNHSNFFAIYTQSLEPLKKLVEDYMNNNLVPNNKDEKYLDEIINSVNGKV